MPLHASYILQLLNVGCFAALKQAYKKEIKGLADSYINYINKKAFLVIFLGVYNKAILKSNILSSF
jgi:NADH:ubiquinone oxidoreductase subunit 4 (subunit M)